MLWKCNACEEERSRLSGLFSGFGKLLFQSYLGKSAASGSVKCISVLFFSKIRVGLVLSITC